MSYYVEVFVDPKDAPKGTKEEMEDFLFDFHNLICTPTVGASAIREMYNKGVDVLQRYLLGTAKICDKDSFTEKHVGQLYVNVHLMSLPKYHEHTKWDYEECISSTFELILKDIERLRFDKDPDAPTVEYLELIDERMFDVAMSHIALKYLDTIEQG